MHGFDVWRLLFLVHQRGNIGAKFSGCRRTAPEANGAQGRRTRRRGRLLCRSARQLAQGQIYCHFDDKDTGLLNTLVISDFIDGMTTDAGDSGALVMLLTLLTS